MLARIRGLLNFRVARFLHHYGTDSLAMTLETGFAPSGIDESMPEASVFLPDSLP